MWNDRDLVLATKGGEDCANIRICERRVEVVCPFPSRGTELARCRKLDRDQMGESLQSLQRLLVDGGGQSRSREGRRQHRDLVARFGLAR